MDCVSASGDLVIAYCAEIAGHGLRLHLQSLLSSIGGRIESRSSVGRYELTARADLLSAGLPKFAFSGTWQALAAPTEREVYREGERCLHWRCLQPASSATVQLEGRAFTGLGYAEQILLDIPPWKLPLTKLYWGRFVSAEHALTWTDWRGSYSTRFAIHDGKATALQAASEYLVEAGGMTLRIEPGLTLRSGNLRSTILPQIPLAQKLLPRSLDIDEHKWCSPGVLRSPGHPDAHGWVIHEVVDWNA